MAQKLVAASASPAAADTAERPSQDGAIASLRHLLRIEADIRACRSVEELSVLLVNELRKMVGARAAYFLDIHDGKPRVTKVSGVTEFDRNAPTIRWLENQLAANPPALGWEGSSRVALKVGPDAQLEEGLLFPFQQGHWLPLRHQNSKPEFGVLLVGEKVLPDASIAIGEHIVETAAHAAVVLVHRAPRPRMRSQYRVVVYALCLGAFAAMFYPVPMTALAPMEVVPQQPFVVAAPIDGVIDTIALAPNSAVKTGDLVVQYVDTVPRNEWQVAEQAVSVASAKLRQLQQSAFIDEKAKRELAQSRAELKLKIAERDFARETFDKSQIRAARDGIVVYADRKEWVGKPVVTGQRILEIADEKKVELRANLPVGEVLDLKPGARVRAFLNGDPLNPVAATVTSMSHQARMVEGQGLVYIVNAQFGAGEVLPRPGVRGTAQLFSDKAPLGYYLFRRPITWLRQKVGL
jgi:multidrug resistance efflux pump